MTITQWIIIASIIWITLSAACAGLYAIVNIRFNERLAAKRERGNV